MIERKLSKKPDFLALAAKKPGFFPGLFQSQSQSEKIGRYDFLFASPAVELVAYDEASLNQLFAIVDSAPNIKAEGEPFQFGWVLYLSYEAAYFMEPKLAHLYSAGKQPLAIALYCQGCVSYNYFDNETKIVAESAEVAQRIVQEVNQVEAFQHRSIQIQQVDEEPGRDFQQAVLDVKTLIASGDIYQANLSRQYTCELTPGFAPADVYSNLEKANPAPFACLFQCNEFAVVSSSPERLLHIKDGLIETRPIAGTRPRSEDVKKDLELIRELIETPKERAEHIMLIDLERNDIGKVCETGSVAVDELMVVESYEHVHHIVSNIKGELLEGVTVIDTLKSLFPGGTITGCPKIRCMEVIRDIENRDRSAYTGSLGYINHDGQADFNILIRTFFMSGQQIKFNAGAGIVFDSDPEAELRETRHKAKGLLNALNST